ncbi:MAG TPA: hypothetical protein VN282_24945 [Pyrinomonadaceae bacterium]|nr:hypothetical protein [Pyrinomonadaceae bacterium]
MEENGDSDIRLETLAAEARPETGGDGFSDEELIGSPSTMRLIDEVSVWAERHYRRDRSDVREHLLFNLRKIGQVKHLKSWLHTVAKNYCVSQGLHDGVVARYDSRCVAENVHYRRARTVKKGGGAAVMLFSPVRTPEQQLELKEQMEEVLRRLDELIAECSDEELVLARLWAEGLETKEIIEATGWPVSTTYRKLGRFQKKLVAGVGVVGDLDEKAVVALQSMLGDALGVAP